MTKKECQYLSKITKAINDTDIAYLTIPMLRHWKGQLYLALLEMFDGCEFDDYAQELEDISNME